MNPRLLRIAWIVLAGVLTLSAHQANRLAADASAPPAHGGPDAFGYVYDTVPYAWTDISTTGTRIAFNTLDDATRLVNLPQRFLLYDGGSTALSVGTNGYASLRTAATYTSCDPALRQPPLALAPFCADLTTAGGNVYYQDLTLNGHPAFILQYQNVTHKASGQQVTFQIILDFADSSITYQYHTTPAGGAGAATVGLIGSAFNVADALTACEGATGCQPVDASALRFYVPPRPTLDLAITPSDFFPNAGAALAYTLTLGNTGNLAAPAAVLTNSLPDGLTFAGGLTATAGAATYEAAGREVRWQGDLAVSDIVTLTYKATLDTADPVYNTATLSHTLAAAPATALSAPADPWSPPEVVAVPHFFDDTLASARHLALDGAGTAHLVYGGNGLYYATRPAAGTWVLETIMPTPTLRPALILDEADRPVMVFSAAGEVMLARQAAATGGQSAEGAASHGAAAGWAIDAIAEGAAERIEVARGADGRLHVVFDRGGAVYYTVESSGGWRAAELVIPAGECATYVGFSLALDAADTPYVACAYRPSSGAQRALRLFKGGGAPPWLDPEVVATNTDAKYYADPSLAFAEGEFHLAFTRYASQVFYGRKTGGAWQVTQIAQAGSLNDSYVSLAVRGAVLAVAYAFHKTPYPDYPTDISLAHRPITDGDWTHEPVESFVPGRDLPYPALVLDASGRGHLAYYYGTDETLRYAIQAAAAADTGNPPAMTQGAFRPTAPAAFTFQTVDRSDTLKGAALTVDEAATVHLAYLAGGLRYADHPPGAAGWAPQIVVPDAAGTWLDLAADATGAPHVVYTGSGGPLSYARGTATRAHLAAAQAWTTAIVDQPGALQSSPAIAVGADAAPHVAYLALAGDGSYLLRYGTLTASHWHTETVAAIGGAAEIMPPPEIAARAGRVHLFYADCTGATETESYAIPLRLATYDGAAWEMQTIDTIYGACNGNLNLRLRTDDTGALVAVADTSSLAMRPNAFRRFYTWPAGGAIVNANTPWPGDLPGQATTTALGPSYLHPLAGLVGLRGGGVEYITYDYRGAKLTTYQTTKTGLTYTSASMQVYQRDTGGMTDQAPIHRNGLGRGGGIAAVTETFGSDRTGAGSVQVQITPPRKPPAPQANASKEATPTTPNAVYPSQPITYHLTLTWQGQDGAPITAADPYDWPSSAYMTDTLQWGSHIAMCQHNPQTHIIGCNGQFPPGGGDTYITFVVSSTCGMYDRRDQEILNQAAVTIGDFDFSPTASTREKTPFRLQAATPAFIPKARFQPGQTVLLYSAPKGDEPDCCTKCALDLYVVVNGKDRFKMQNDGGGQGSRANADFISEDCHHSLWYEPTENKPYTFDLYVVSQGQPFEEAVLADTFVLAPTVTPKLVVLTDFRELFNEFAQTDLRSPVEDRNQNCRPDYYDAVARITQYAAAHGGIIFDIRQDAYAQDHLFGAGIAKRQEMGRDIDKMMSQIDVPRGLSHLAIIGDDAVVPFYRLMAAGGGVMGGFNEHSFAFSWGGSGNPTITDYGVTTGGASQGHFMSDVPYSDFSFGPQDKPWPDLGAARLFTGAPLDLINAINSYEQPLSLAAGTTRAFIFNTNNDSVAFARFTQKTVLEELKAYYGGHTELLVTPSTWGGALGNQAYYVDGNRVLWTPADFIWAADRAQILVNVAHGAHSESDARAGSITRLSFPGANALSKLMVIGSCHAGLTVARQQTQPANPANSEWRAALGLKAMENGISYVSSTSYDRGSHYIINHDLQRRAFFRELRMPENRTIGDLFRHTFTTYRGELVLWYLDSDWTTQHSLIQYGLPTRRIDWGNQARLQAAQISTAAPAAQAGAVTLAGSFVQPYFERADNPDGTSVLTAPYHGEIRGVEFMPALPVAFHNYTLPPEAADIQVTVTGVQTHTYDLPITLERVIPVNRSLGAAAGDPPPITAIYPAEFLGASIRAEDNKSGVAVMAALAQVHPDGRIILYDRIDYQVTYTVDAAAVTISDVTINQGAAVPVNQVDLPAEISLTALANFTGHLEWRIEDASGLIWTSGEGGLDVAAGASSVTLTFDTLGWRPGPRWLHAHVIMGRTLEESGEVIANFTQPFAVTGRGLALAVDKTLLAGQDPSAGLLVTVRDETGRRIAGLAPALRTRLDAAERSLAWQETAGAAYSATMPLAGLGEGAHSLAVNLPGGETDQATFTVDRSAPTSSAASPAEVAAPAGITLTLSGNDAGSGIATYQLQYQAQGSAQWLDWQSQPAGWDYAKGSPADDTLTFGPAHPITLRAGTTYCFRSQATDRAGNVEAAHLAADSCTRYNGPRRIYLPLVLRS